MFRVARDGEVRTQVNLGHGPPFGSVGAKTGEFADRGDARGRVGDHTTESQRLFVALTVVRFGGARQRVDHLFAHVGRANEGLANVRGDVARQGVLGAGLGLAGRRARHGAL